MSYKICSKCHDMLYSFGHEDNIQTFCVKCGNKMDLVTSVNGTKVKEQ